MHRPLERKRGERGFTMLEVVIAGAVIAVLFAVATPMVAGAQAAAREASVEETAHRAWGMAKVALESPEGLDVARLEERASSGRNVAVTLTAVGDAPEDICVKAYWRDETAGVPSAFRGEACATLPGEDSTEVPPPSPSPSPAVSEEPTEEPTTEPTPPPTEEPTAEPTPPPPPVEPPAPEPPAPPVDPNPAGLEAGYSLSSKWGSGYVVSMFPKVAQAGKAVRWTVAWEDPYATSVASAWGMNCTVGGGWVKCSSVGYGEEHFKTSAWGFNVGAQINSTRGDWASSNPPLTITSVKL